MTAFYFPHLPTFISNRFGHLLCTFCDRTCRHVAQPNIPLLYLMALSRMNAIFWTQQLFLSLLPAFMHISVNLQNNDLKADSHHMNLIAHAHVFCDIIATDTGHYDY